MRWLCMVVVCGCRLDFDPMKEDLGTVATPSDSIPFGLVAWFPFDQQLLDLVSNTNATCVGKCPAFAPGAIDQATVFDGTSCLRVPRLAAWNPLHFTIAAWVNASAMTNPIVVRDYDPGCTSPAVQTANGGIGFQATSVTSSHEEAWTARVIAMGQWQHIAVRWDGVEQQVFVDGVCACALQQQYPFKYSASEVDIGCAPSVGTHLRGMLDDVRIYDRLLSLDEIATLASGDGRATPTTLDCTQLCGTAAP